MPWDPCWFLRSSAETLTASLPGVFGEARLRPGPGGHLCPRAVVLRQASSGFSKRRPQGPNASRRCPGGFAWRSDTSPVTHPAGQAGIQELGTPPTWCAGGVAESYYRAGCTWGRGLWPRPRVQSAPAGAPPSVHRRSSGSMGVPSACGLGGHAEAGLVQRKIVPEPPGGSLTTHQSGSPFLFPDISLPLPPATHPGFCYVMATVFLIPHLSLSC